MATEEIRISRQIHGALVVIVTMMLIVMTSATSTSARSSAHHAVVDPVPVLAYYYIWFDPTSWNRAKTDYPLSGRYSSDDPKVMQDHVRWAKAAGINGFIVSWKSTPTLNRRLEQLVEIAAAEQFKLVVIYQGLDFHREPLDVEQISGDLDYFIARWENHEVFDLFGKPVVIWSGTWEFTLDEIAGVTDGHRDHLQILASERDLDRYSSLVPYIDGNAYYWSSVDPETHPNYPLKLIEMSEAVHASRGLWIAPAAPGFDARLIGGTRVVERKDGATFQKQFDGAMRSAPDAVGIISWNEFSENSHIEPSENHGDRYLQVLGNIRGAKPPRILNFESDSPAATGTWNGFPIIAAMVILFVGSLVLILRRSPNRPPEQGDENVNETPGDIRLHPN